MIITPKMIAARIEVERTKAALAKTARELQMRLMPRTLVAEAWEKAKDKGADLAEEAVDAVKSRPVAVGGVLAAVTMFLAREPIRDAAVKFYDAITSKDAAKAAKPALKRKDKLKPADKPPPVRRRPRKSARAATKTEKVT